MTEDEGDEGGGCHAASGAARGSSLLPLALALALAARLRRRNE
jgi:MYXO-CTERM domain-containing protein